MNEIDIATLFAVFQELLVWTLWPIVAACVVATLAFVWVLVRDRSVVAARIVYAELLRLIGGVAAVAVMFIVTHSTPSDLGGPIDWLLVAGIFVAGLIGTSVGGYALMGLVACAPAVPPRRSNMP